MMLLGLSLGAGLALFLFGMTALSGGLQGLASGRLERGLRLVSGSFVRAVATGMLATAMLQSSSALTVLVVGFSAAGLLDRRACTGLIVGANVGTCVTAQLVRLGLCSGGLGALEQPWILAAACVGCGLCLFPRRPALLGVCAGLLALFTGMAWMTRALTPLAEKSAVRHALELCMGNPGTGLLAGLLVTAILQSSSASVGMLQALAQSQPLPVSAVVPVVIGQNIGTCVTGLLASVGGGTAAHRTAWIHVRFNVCGALCAIPFVAFFSVCPFAFWCMRADCAVIADFHLLFNVCTALVFCALEQAKSTGCVTLPHLLYWRAGGK